MAEGKRCARLVRALLLATPGFLCLGTLALPADLQAGLAWERSALATGEWWRLWSGHFVHHGAAHALANGAGLLLLAGWLGRGAGPRLQLPGLGLAAPLLSLALLPLAPDLAAYRGASGLVVLLATVAAFDALARPGERFFGSALLAGLMLKVALEAGGVALPASLPEGIRVVWQTHAVGLMLGTAMAGARSRAWLGHGVSAAIPAAPEAPQPVAAFARERLAP